MLQNFLKPAQNMEVTSYPEIQLFHLETKMQPNSILDNELPTERTQMFCHPYDVEKKESNENCIVSTTNGHRSIPLELIKAKLA